jgi:hypothetical protein
MTMRAVSRAMIALACVAGLALVAWGYGALGPVWFLQALPWCS